MQTEDELCCSCAVWHHTHSCTPSLPEPRYGVQLLAVHSTLHVPVSITACRDASHTRSQCSHACLLVESITYRMTRGQRSQPWVPVLALVQTDNRFGFARRATVCTWPSCCTGFSSLPRLRRYEAWPCSAEPVLHGATCRVVKLASGTVAAMRRIGSSLSAMSEVSTANRTAGNTHHSSMHLVVWLI